MLWIQVRIRIKLKGRIRMHIYVIIWIRIRNRIKVINWIRIRNPRPHKLADDKPKCTVWKMSLFEKFFKVVRSYDLDPEPHRSER